MYKLKARDGRMNKRMLNVEELCAYIGMGKTTARSWAETIGCVRHIGRRVLFDRIVVDTALDNLAENERLRKCD